MAPGAGYPGVSRSEPEGRVPIVVESRSGAERVVAVASLASYRRFGAELSSVRVGMALRALPARISEGEPVRSGAGLRERLVAGHAGNGPVGAGQREREFSVLRDADPRRGEGV